ncbi:MAG TPA: hypothetical protein VEF76_11970, partial [Patescibacteria group bacterium]|nr:hypothetical protein [Patescibacteria group bacterium]
PLGAGTHIDHRTAFEAAQKLSGVELRFYEDRPYILWPGVLKGRMNALGIDADVRNVTPQEMAATIGNYHYLTHFVPPGQHRADTLPIYQAALAPPPGFVFKAIPETLTATEPELRRMFDALAAYESQMPFIYSDYDNFIRDSMTYDRHAGNAAYTERSWRLQPL